MDPHLRIHVYDTEPALARAAATAFVASAGEVLSKRDRFTVALAGGSTPKTLYAWLASEYRDTLAWDRVHFFWTDERFVSPDDPESNYRMAREVLLDPLGLPHQNIHFPDTGASEPSDAAERYQVALCAFFGSELPRFDWIFLGMGEDGHTASLFPGSDALQETERLVLAVHDSPKPPPVRITMTFPLLNAAREIHFLIAGRRKQDAFSKILRQENVHLPAQRVRPIDGTVDWWVAL
jgi:6-phosphogluconolactonase